MTQKLSLALVSSAYCFVCKKAARLFDEICRSDCEGGLKIDLLETDFIMEFSHYLSSYDEQSEALMINGMMGRLKLRVLFWSKDGSERLELSTNFQICSPHPCHVDSFCATSSLID